MKKQPAHGAYEVLARWDSDAGVWVAESEDVPGLVAEAESPNGLAEKVKLLIPELLELNGVPTGHARFHIRYQHEESGVLASLMASYTPKVKEILRAQGCYFERPGPTMKSGTPHNAAPLSRRSANIVQAHGKRRPETGRYRETVLIAPSVVLQDFHRYQRDNRRPAPPPAS
jgi:hypothetical protein